jgi:uncharacterized protein YciI
MTFFSVVREAGPAWAAGGIFDQPAVSEHAAFMNALADGGYAVFGGPLGGTEVGRVRVLLVARAESEAEIRSRLADDPWERTEQIVTVTAEPWRILVGEVRFLLAGAQAATSSVAGSTTPGPSPGTSG